MESQIYSTNSNDAILKDFGPFKIRVADQSIKGQKTFEYKQVTQQIIVGQQIKVDTKTQETNYQKIDLYK